MILDKLVGGPLKGLAEKVGWKFVNDKLTKAYPTTWPAIKHAMLGWKTLTGLAIVYWPTIAAGISEGFGYLNQIIGLLGMHSHVDGTASLLFLGKALVAIGAADKALKFIIHFFSDEVDKLPSSPVLETEAEFDKFLNRYATYRHDGVAWDQARRIALENALLDRQDANAKK